MPAIQTRFAPVRSPFDPSEDALFEKWCDLKLRDYPRTLDDIVVKVRDPRALSTEEFAAFMHTVRKTNMAVYVSATGSDPDRAIPLLLAARLGVSAKDHNWLSDYDGLTSLKVTRGGTRQHYIPYTNRAIKWHTDGYYNTAEQQIRTLNLHCVSPSAKGGENQLLDHEIAYMTLRRANPDYIRALMAPDAMTIPARIEEGGTVARPEKPGPVFSICPLTGNLHMRYTLRERNVIWKRDAMLYEALEFLAEMLESDSPYIFRGRLGPGMGLVSTNVLHDRAGFADSPDSTRLIYRARYFDRIRGTNLKEVYPELFG